MKSIQLKNNSKEYKNFFSEIAESNTAIISWQVGEDQSRTIRTCQISSFEIENNFFESVFIDKKNDLFNLGTIYFYIESKNTIFKAELVSVNDEKQKSTLPTELKKLNEDESKSLLNEMKNFVKGYGHANILTETTRVSGAETEKNNANNHMRYNSNNSTDHISTKWRMTSMSKHDSELFETELSFVALDEEDKLYADQRAAPRARPPKNKMINIQHPTIEDKSIFYSLFDLSQGGLGFIVLSADEFQVDQKLNVLGFDDKQFDSPMVIVVRAIRDVDESGALFKVGCAFQG